MLYKNYNGIGCHNKQVHDKYNEYKYGEDKTTLE